MQEGDIELTVAALEACGYRVRVREKNYTRWVTACKGLDVKYVTWHPLTNITQAMQLLMDHDHTGVSLKLYSNGTGLGFVRLVQDDHPTRCDTPQEFINAQCRAIVSACAALKAVR